eukprot:TRINITY_DN30294_c0_g1_i1.p1 TRINITY_DN30294_c0_g1~~TRINITY_DN30294_c0_g1_i1.p1  ORF type:complete len:505 (+),score=234.88 TRINITY_DN30294_c0_g1_i1:94-1515(+)
MGFLQKVDAFRTIPKDFCESGTNHGAFLTLAAACLCTILFGCELNAFLTVVTRTRIVMDSNQDELLKINFDVTLHDLPCSYVSVGVWDSFGSDRLNITKNVQKQKIDHEGKAGDAYTEDELLEIESQELALTEEEKVEYDADWSSSSDNFKHDSFQSVIEAHDMTMLLFYADWCAPCMAFKPTWNKFEDWVNKGKNGQAAPEVIDADGKTITGIRVLKINCVEFKQVCYDESIQSFPSVRLYRRSVGKQNHYVAYEGKRSEDALFDFLKTEAKKRHLHSGAKHHSMFKEGCRVRGFVEVARVPGTLHFEAKSADQKTMLNSAFTNVSHEVHHLSFGEETPVLKVSGSLPKEYQRHISPLDEKNFAVDMFHQAPHHYIKVVSTTFESWGGVRSYQMTHQHRIANINKKTVPQAKFSYDLAPVEVIVTSERKKKWYDFFTSALAIVGGTYTVMGLMSGAFNMASRQFKSNMGKLS